jgi:hypothetical protein
MTCTATVDSAAGFGASCNGGVGVTARWVVRVELAKVSF